MSSRWIAAKLIGVGGTLAGLFIAAKFGSTPWALACLFLFIFLLTLMLIDGFCIRLEDDDVRDAKRQHLQTGRSIAFSDAEWNAYLSLRQQMFIRHTAFLWVPFLLLSFSLPWAAPNQDAVRVLILLLCPVLLAFVFNFLRQMRQLQKSSKTLVIGPYGCSIGGAFDPWKLSSSGKEKVRRSELKRFKGLWVISMTMIEGLPFPSSHIPFPENAGSFALHYHEKFGGRPRK